MLWRTVVRTPTATLYLVSDEHVLLGAGFRSFQDLFERMDPADANRDSKLINSIPIISDLVNDYYEGDLNALNAIKVRQPGAEFSQSVWKAMRKIHVGKTVSYAELADRIGSPKAVRAVGTACAKNLVAPIIPCHRVLKTGGALGNYGYGLEMKDWLLRHEGAL